VEQKSEGGLEISEKQSQQQIIDNLPKEYLMEFIFSNCTVKGIKFHPDKPEILLVILSSPNGMMLFNLKKKKNPIASYQLYNTPNIVTWSPDGKFVALSYEQAHPFSVFSVSLESNVVRLVPADEWVNYKDVQNNTEQHINALLFTSPEILVIAYKNASISVWDITRCRRISENIMPSPFHTLTNIIEGQIMATSIDCLLFMFVGNDVTSQDTDMKRIHGLGEITDIIYYDNRIFACGKDSGLVEWDKDKPDDPIVVKRLFKNVSKKKKFENKHL